VSRKCSTELNYYICLLLLDVDFGIFWFRQISESTHDSPAMFFDHTGNGCQLSRGSPISKENRLRNAQALQQTTFERTQEITIQKVSGAKLPVLSLS